MRWLTETLHVPAESIVLSVLEVDGKVEVHATIDWVGVEAALEDRIEKLLGEIEGTKGWSVMRIPGFCDFHFPPCPDWMEAFLYEHCIVRGPARYGAVGHYFDGYRFYVGANDVRSDVSGFLDMEDSLETCVRRIARYIQTGEGSREVLGIKRYVRGPELGPRG